MCRQETEVPTVPEIIAFVIWRLDVPTGYVIFQCTCELQDGCADRRRVCRQERGAPTEEGCAEKKRRCRQEMKAFMNWRLDELREDGCADRRLMCRQEMDMLAEVMKTCKVQKIYLLFMPLYSNI